MRLVKRVLVVVGAFGLTTLLVGLVIYVYGGLPLIIKLIDRQVSEPTNEEYAVYSAFIDDFFSTRQPFRWDQQIDPGSAVYIVDMTLDERFSHPLPPVLGVDAFDPIQDFHRQNNKSWRLQPNFHPHMKWALVQAGSSRRAASRRPEESSLTDEKRDLSNWLPHQWPEGQFPENSDVCGVLQFSRVGLNWRSSTAVLSYSYVCGHLCGQSGSEVRLEKDGRQWRVTEWGGGFVY